jgi:hypothetical protein
VLACVAATCINPYGWRIYEWVLLTSRMATERRIDEWLPPGPNLLIGKAWVLSLLLLLVLFAVQRRRPAWREICLLCCFLPLACASVRLIVWWLLVSAPILAAQLATSWAQWRPQPTEAPREPPTRFAAVACLTLLLGAVLSLPWMERVNPVFALPGRAHRTENDLQAIVEQLPPGQAGRIFTRFSWGEYLIWGLPPGNAVFMDGRIEIYPDEVWARYGAITRGRGDWQEVLDEHQVNYLLLDDSGYHGELLPLVERSPKWRERARQGSAVLFERREPDQRASLPASPSASTTMSSSNRSPNSQKPGSVTSTPSLASSRCGASDPPAASSSR